MNIRSTNVPDNKAKPGFAVLLVLVVALLFSVAVSAENREPQSVPQVDSQPTEKTDYSEADFAARILKIQFDLRKLGHYSGVLDGVLNSATRDAIRSYQLEQMMDIDGKFSDELENSLSEKVGRL